VCWSQPCRQVYLEGLVRVRQASTPQKEITHKALRTRPLQPTKLSCLSIHMSLGANSIVDCLKIKRCCRSRRSLLIP
jgi:hypothetical protein